MQLNHAESLGLSEQVAEAEPRLFVITGGDPMCRPDLLELICAASRKGLRVCLSPSATPRVLRADFPTLREAGVAGMSLSLDGPDRASHDQFRNVPGTWDRSLEMLRKAKSAGIPMQINTTITAENIHRFDEFVALMRNLEPDSWSLFLVVPTGRATIKDLPSPQQVEVFFEKLAELSGEVPFRIKTTDGQHFRRLLKQRVGASEPAHFDGPPTNAGRGFVFVGHTGEIYPSGFLPIKAGNIKTDRLLDVYREHPIFRQLRNPAALKGKCGVCSFNDICGGSRARAFAMRGDYLAADPLCPYQPNLNAQPYD
jgi:radical SAM protein with 4Fe4S-binding SPASM domain